MATATLFETFLETFLTDLPAILSLAIILIAWVVSFRLALRRKSRGLLLVSRAFLIKWIIDGAWDTYFYIFLGGPIGIINSLQNSSGVSIPQTLGLYYFAGTVTSTITLALMVFFVIRGGLVAIVEQRPREIVALPTSPQ